MPAAVVAASITGAVQLGTSVYGAKKQGAAAKRASDVQSRGATDALDFEKERDRLDRIEDARVRKQERDEYDRTEKERKTAWDAEEARKAPKRAYAEAARARMAAELGLPAPPPRVYPGYPAGSTAPTGPPTGSTAPTGQMTSSTAPTGQMTASAGSMNAAGDSGGSMGNVGYKPQYGADPTQSYLSSANMGPVQGPAVGYGAAQDSGLEELPESGSRLPRTSRQRPMSQALQYRRQQER